jgi:hypothetical protein
MNNKQFSKILNLIKDEELNKDFNSLFTSIEKNSLITKYEKQLKNILIFFNVHPIVEKIEFKIYSATDVGCKITLNTDLEFYKECFIEPLPISNERDLRIKLTLRLADFLDGYFKYNNSVRKVG